MAHRRFRVHNSASRKAMARRRRRAIGTTGAISAFLTFGLGPLAHAPKARAEGFDAVIDQTLTAITGSLGDLSGVSGTAPELGGLGAGAADAGSVAAANPAGAWLHALAQDFNGLDQDADNVLGKLFNLVNHVGSSGEAPTGAMSQNLLVNGNFATADPSGSGFEGVTIPGWTETGVPTVIPYDTPINLPGPILDKFTPTFSGLLGFPTVAPPGTPAGDDNFAGGGPVGTSSISQTVNLTGAAGTPFELSADLGGQSWDPSYTSVQVSFLGADGDVLGTDSLNPVTALDRLGFTGFEYRDITGTVPEGTTSAQVTTTFNDETNFLEDYNSAYAADESFTVGDPSLTAAPLTPPTSDVGHLDHVFLIYLENEGDEQILDNQNASFIDSLIKTGDFDSGYHSLGHPSNPNYDAVFGGSAFGRDTNAYPGGINAPNLFEEWDKAGVSWAAYEQDIPAGTTEINGGFGNVGAFNYVADNTQAYLDEHIFPQADLSSALQDPSTFPDFAWVKPNVVTSGEPFNGTFFSDLRYIANEVFPAQSVVDRYDLYLENTVKTIEDSPTWNDPNETDAIFITYDEDASEPSLGIENTDDNVPLIVIPNQGAVTEGGMLDGVHTDAYNNIYGLMATIADATSPASGTLAPLTANEEYATPLNAFWK